MHYYLYKDSTGELVSDSAEPIEPKSGYSVKSLESKQVGIWNVSTLAFDPVPAISKFSKSSFYKKVGLSLFGKVVAESKNDIEIETLLEYIKGLNTIDFNDAELIYGVNLLVSKEVWTQEELDGVLDV